MRRNPSAWNQATTKRDDMTSEMKKVANRQNAQASTGPRSQAGKARAAANARRHGLAIPPWFDRRYSAEVERVARQNASSFPNPRPQLLAHARRLLKRSSISSGPARCGARSCSRSSTARRVTGRENARTCRAWLQRSYESAVSGYCGFVTRDLPWKKCNWCYRIRLSSLMVSSDTNGAH